MTDEQTKILQQILDLQQEQFELMKKDRADVAAINQKILEANERARADQRANRWKVTISLICMSVLLYILLVLFNQSEKKKEQQNPRAVTTIR
jgi:hypothetical protein